MSSTIEDVLQVASIGLAVIRQFASDQARTAVDIADAILKVLDALDDASTQKITPAQAKAKIEALQASLKSTDAAADAALEAKFLTSEILSKVLESGAKVVATATATVEPELPKPVSDEEP